MVLDIGPDRVQQRSIWLDLLNYSETCLKRPLKRRQKNSFQDRLSLSTFIKLHFVIKIFVLSIFEWPLKTGLLYTGPV